ncbi:MAG: IclR family transcriptional regulator [Geobacter sp.]|nr:IclR family transcriptional regulator [Geobacter sp.]
MQKKEKAEYMIQAVSHALDLMEKFSEETPELGITELSKKLKLHKNNVFRLLATLETRGYVEQNRVTGNYHLGLKTLELRKNFIRQMDLLPQARPILLALAHECNETCYVAVMKEFRSVYLDVVETPQVVRIVSRIGSRLPAHCTAAGKVQLAYFSEKELVSFFAKRELTRFTPNTITDQEELRRHLQEIADQGYAIDDEELEAGVRGVAAPIHSYENRVAGALIISGPSMRFTDERIKRELAPLLVRAAGEISTRLGYSGK